MKTWLITGVSRGLGLALAQAALARGDRVIGTVREGAPPLDDERFECLTLDVTDRAAVTAEIGKAFASAGRIDIVVNNAGYGLLGAVEEASSDEVTRIFDVNFLGVLAVIQAALPHLRAQRAGHIISITSIAGRAPGAGAGIYAAAKHAVEGLSKCLAAEVAPLGIKVSVVAPGAFRTDFLTDHSIRRSAPIAGAYPAVETMRGRFAAMDGQQQGDPERAAKAILALADTDQPPLHLLLGSDALERERSALARLTADMARWEETTLGTDFAD